MDNEKLLELNSQELADIIYKSMTEKDNLIKYLEDKITHLKQCQSMALESRYKEEAREFNLRIADYQDILEKLNGDKYE